MKYYDFDASLSEFAQAWYEVKQDELNPDEIEDRVEEIFDEWKDAVVEELGVSPKVYFSGLSDAALLEHLTHYQASGIPSVLMDELGVRRSLIPSIREMVKKATEDELTQTAMSILQEFGDSEILHVYLDWIMKDGFSEDLTTHAIEILAEHASELARELRALIPLATGSARDHLADVVVYAPANEAGYQLLVERLMTQENIPLYASYLSKYGDERAIEPMKTLAKTCDFVSYVELSNAVEALGGEMDVERDFSKDPSYLKIKRKLEPNTRLYN